MIRYDLRRLFPRSAVVALCLVCLGAFHSPVRAAFTHAQWSSGWTVDWDGGRMGPTAQWVPAASTNTAGGASWAVTGGNLTGSATGRINNGPGYIDVQAKVVPTKPTVGAAIAKAARKLGPLATGMAIVDLARDLGFALSGSGDEVGYQKADPAVCSVAPCYDYYVNSIAGGAASGWKSTAIAACTQAAANYTAIAGGNTGRNPVVVGSTCYVDLHNSSGGFITQTNASITTQSKPPAPATYIPSTEQEFIDSIALASGWPTSSNFPKAVAQAIDAGELIPGTVTVSGPSSSQGPKATATDSAGNVTQQQTVYNYSYADNRITYTTSTVTTVNGVTQSTTVKEGEKPQDDCEGRNTAGCVDLDTPQTEVPKSTKNLTYTPEDLGLGSGSCPAPIPVNTSRGNWSIDLAPYCAATETYVKPMVILVAMFLAYLIMTGAKLGGD